MMIIIDHFCLLIEVIDVDENKRKYTIMYVRFFSFLVGNDHWHVNANKLFFST